MAGPFETFHIFNHSDADELGLSPQETVWKELCGALARVSQLMDTRIHAFLLMSNHYHLLMSCRVGCTRLAMNWLITNDFAKAFWPRGWAGDEPYRYTLIGHPKQYRVTFRYVAQNPLCAGLVSRVEDYPYSTIHYRFMGKPLPFLIRIHPWARKSVLDYAVDDKLNWLNESSRNAVPRLVSRR